MWRWGAVWLRKRTSYPSIRSLPAARSRRSATQWRSSGSMTQRRWQSTVRGGLVRHRRVSAAHKHGSEHPHLLERLAVRGGDRRTATPLSSGQWRNIGKGGPTPLGQPLDLGADERHGRWHRRDADRHQPDLGPIALGLQQVDDDLQVAPLIGHILNVRLIPAIHMAAILVYGEGRCDQRQLCDGGIVEALAVPVREAGEFRINGDDTINLPRDRPPQSLDRLGDSVQDTGDARPESSSPGSPRPSSTAPSGIVSSRSGAKTG